MNNELEATWDHVGAVWRTDERPSPVAERLAERVQRQARRLPIIVAGEVLVTILVLSAVFSAVARHGTAGSLRVGAMALLYTAGVWAFSLWNRRGLWQPYGETTADFIALLRIRAERRIRAAWFCLIVIGLAAILVAREIETAWRAGRISTWEWGVWIGIAVYSTVVVVWSLWYRRRAESEIRELDRLAEDLERGARSEERAAGP